VFDPFPTRYCLKDDFAACLVRQAPLEIARSERPAHPAARKTEHHGNGANEAGGSAKLAA